MQIPLMKATFYKGPPKYRSHEDFWNITQSTILINDVIGSQKCLYNLITNIIQCFELLFPIIDN